MKSRVIVIAVALIAVAVFAAGIAIYRGGQQEPAPATVAGLFERPHSPTYGPADAPVTIVEFFDPACETCRAFHPLLKNILEAFAAEVRLVLRYTTLHAGSEEAARILEAARLQGLFDPVLQALYDAQPAWASHSAPNIELAWAAAGRAGLDVARARADANSAAITAVLREDAADVAAVGVRATPTFYVNGRSLPSFGSQQLLDLVRAEVERARAASAAASGQ